MKKGKIVYLVLTLLFSLVAVSEAAVITMNVTPDTVPADGSTQATISAQLLGGYNQPLANKTIYFSTTGGILTKTAVQTDANGWAYTSLTSTEPGEVTISARFYRTVATVSVTFIENIVDCPPKGIYTFVYLGNLDSLLKNESVAGISIRISWNSVEPEEGVFDWSYIDDLISQAESAGKKVSITIIPGTDSPEWVYAKGARKYIFIDRNPYHETYGQELYCPMPWDDVYLTAWRNFIEALAARYNENPAVSWIRITGPMNITTGDWNLKSDEDWDKYIGTEDEYSDEKVITVVEQVIDWFATSFPSKSLSIAISPSDDTPIKDIAEYGFTNYYNQFNIQINSLNAKIPPYDEPGLELFKRFAPYTGAQMIWSATNDPYCRLNGGITPCDPYTSLSGAINKAIEYNISFLEIYPVDILNPDLQNILREFNNK